MGHAQSILNEYQPDETPLLSVAIALTEYVPTVGQIWLSDTIVPDATAPVMSVVPSPQSKGICQGIAIGISGGSTVAYDEPTNPDTLPDGVLGVPGAVLGLAITHAKGADQPDETPLMSVAIALTR